MGIPNQSAGVIRNGVNAVRFNTDGLSPQQQSAFNPWRLSCYFHGIPTPCWFILPFCGIAFKCTYHGYGRVESVIDLFGSRNLSHLN